MPRTLFVILIAVLAQATPGTAAQSAHTVLWKFKTGNGVFSSPAIGTDGTIYVGSLDHKVYAINGQTGEKKWEFNTLDWVPPSVPIGTDGTLHVRSADNKAYPTKTSGVGLAKTAWPKFGQNARHTGCATAAVPTAEVTPAPVAGAKTAQSESRSLRQQPTKSGKSTE